MPLNNRSLWVRGGVTGGLLWEGSYKDLTLWAEWDLWAKVDHLHFLEEVFSGGQTSHKPHTMLTGSKVICPFLSRCMHCRLSEPLVDKASYSFESPKAKSSWLSFPVQPLNWNLSEPLVDKASYSFGSPKAKSSWLSFPVQPLNY